MHRVDVVSEQVCEDVIALNEDVSPQVAEAVSLALISGAARGLLTIAREQGREGEMRGRIRAALCDPAAADPVRN